MAGHLPCGVASTGWRVGPRIVPPPSSCSGDREQWDTQHGTLPRFRTSDGDRRVLAAMATGRMT